MSGNDSRRIRVAIPSHLERLAGVGHEVWVELPPADPPTVRRVLDALEADHPTLRGTIRDHDTGARRPHLRYFAGKEDWSHEPTDAPLPGKVAEGDEIFRVLGAISGG
jgi:molybdopterin synthase sulfur carrier subunit